MQMERSSSKRKYKNSRYETYFFICGFCMILIILIYGITTIFKELHEKNVKEKELESTIVKLRDALDHDFLFHVSLRHEDVFLISLYRAKQYFLSF